MIEFPKDKSFFDELSCDKWIFSDDIDSPEEKFAWLKNEPYCGHIKDDYDFEKQIKNLVAEAERIKITIPNSFIYFTSRSELMRKILSAKWASFWLTNHIDEFNGLYFVRFFADSQGARYWYLCLTKDSKHCVVYSDNEYGVNDGLRYESKTFASYCAPSFYDFIYEYWKENKIWYEEYEKECKEREERKKRMKREKRKRNE